MSTVLKYTVTVWSAADTNQAGIDHITRQIARALDAVDGWRVDGVERQDVPLQVGDRVRVEPWQREDGIPHYAFHPNTFGQPGGSTVVGTVEAVEEVIDDGYAHVRGPGERLPFTQWVPLHRVTRLPVDAPLGIGDRVRVKAWEDGAPKPRHYFNDRTTGRVVAITADDNPVVESDTVGTISFQQIVHRDLIARLP